MPTLNRIGRKAALNHHHEVPLHPLKDATKDTRQREKVREDGRAALTDEELVVNLANMCCEEKTDAR
jgi:hypothetical protein